MQRRTPARSAWPANLRGTQDTSLDGAACAPGANMICSRRSQAARSCGKSLWLPESPHPRGETPESTAEWRAARRPKRRIGFWVGAETPPYRALSAQTEASLGPGEGPQGTSSHFSSLGEAAVFIPGGWIGQEP